MNARKFLDVVAQYALEHQWRITLMNDGMAPTSWKGDGALFSYSRSAAQVDYIRRFVRRKVPMIGLSYVDPSIKMPRVLVDYAADSRLAAEHLWSRGYATYCFYTTERFASGKIAHTAFAARLREHGYTGDVPWVVREEIVPKDRIYDWPVVTAAVKRHVLSGSDPVGVYCQSDSAAINVLDTALESGLRVPSDVGVLGTNDNAVFCENQQVPLSSVNPDYRRLALEACERLNRAMNGEPLPKEPIWIPPLGISERASTGIGSGGDDLFVLALSCLEAHLSQSYGVEQLATELGVSTSTINRLFRNRSGATPAGELRKLRLRKAKTLLRTTDWTLECIAREAGFSHAAHFLNAFHKAEGLTPSDWRRHWR